MKPIDCMVVDDEPLARVWLTQLLAAHTQFKVVGEAADILQAAAAVRRHRPEVLFLDVQFPVGNGFELMRELMPDPPQVVFTAGDDGHALQAFEVNALDYLLKPVNPDRLAITLDRIRQRVRPSHSTGPDRWPSDWTFSRQDSASCRAGEGGSLSAPPSRQDGAGRARGRQSGPQGFGWAGSPTPSCVEGAEVDGSALIRAGASGCFFRIDQIVRITADGNYTSVLTADGHEVMVRHTMAGWKARLPGDAFVHADRACIINLRRVSMIDFSSHSATVRFDRPAAALQLGRPAAERLRQTLARQLPASRDQSRILESTAEPALRCSGARLRRR